MNENMSARINQQFTSATEAALPVSDGSDGPQSFKTFVI
jgi:hypothetical protein